MNEHDGPECWGGSNPFVRHGDCQALFGLRDSGHLWTENLNLIKLACLVHPCIFKTVLHSTCFRSTPCYKRYKKYLNTVSINVNVMYIYNYIYFFIFISFWKL